MELEGQTAPKFIFVAFYPREKREIPAYFEELEKSGWTVMHPAFHWESPEGQRVMASIRVARLSELPSSSDPWSQSASRDYFAIQSADIMVYDTDNEPGYHFLAVAQIYRIPVVAVSASLLSIPAYFSGIVKSVVKPQDLLRSLTQ